MTWDKVDDDDHFDQSDDDDADCDNIFDNTHIWHGR